MGKNISRKNIQPQLIRKNIKIAQLLQIVQKQIQQSINNLKALLTHSCAQAVN